MLAARIGPSDQAFPIQFQRFRSITGELIGHAQRHKSYGLEIGTVWIPSSSLACVSRDN
jgi:hypothetical protein